MAVAMRLAGIARRLLADGLYIWFLLEMMRVAMRRP
jgi:hypothetical protein